MDEQLLKDFIATAQANDYNYDTVMPKFPELEGVDLQLLKDYVATAEYDNYNYDVINKKFPELFPDASKKKEDGVSSGADGISGGFPVVEEEVVDPDVTSLQEYQESFGVIPDDEQTKIFKERLNKIDVANKSEEELVPELNALFGDYDFKFEEAGITDNVKIIAPNEKEKIVNIRAIPKMLDVLGVENFLYGSEKEESEIKTFIKRNRDISINVEDRREKILNEEELKDFTEKFNNEAESYINQANALEQERLNINKLYKDTQEGTPEYNEFILERDKYFKKQAELLDLRKKLTTQGEEYDAIVGEYALMRQEQGTFLGQAYDTAKKGIGNLLGFAAEAAAIPVAFGLSRTAKKGQSFDEVLKEVKYGKEDRFINPFSEKATLLSRDLKKGFVEMAEEAPFSVLGRTSTEEYLKDYQQADLFSAKGIGNVFFGVIEFLPAALLGMPGTIAASAQYVNQEMRDNPRFDNVSEMEKMGVSLAIGSVIGALERIGFKSVMNSKLMAGPVSSILRKVISKNPATMKSFDEFVRLEVNSLVGKGLLRIGAGGVAEFETGAAQEASDIALKTLYNDIKGLQMFDTPANTEETINQILMGGVAEAIGGKMMAAPKALSYAVGTNDLSEVNDNTFRIFEEMSKDPKYIDLVNSKLDQEVVNGKITTEEKNRILTDYNRLNGAMQQMPKDIKTKDKKLLLQLFMDYQALDTKIKKTDDVFNKKDKEARDAIENRIDAILEANEIETSAEDILNTKPEEKQVFYVEKLEDVPEKYRDRATRLEDDGTGITFRETVFGLPIGKRKNVEVGEYYSYTLDGTEIDQQVEENTETDKDAELDSIEKDLDEMFEKTVSAKEEAKVEEEPVTADQKVGDIVGRQVTIDGEKGILKESGQRIVFQTVGDVVTELDLGSKSELMLAPVSEIGAETVELQPLEKAEFKGKVFTIETPIETTSGKLVAGEVTLVSSKIGKNGQRVVTLGDSKGLRRRVTGSAAEQIMKAYKTQQDAPMGDYFSSNPPGNVVQASEDVYVVMGDSKLENRQRKKYERIVDQATKAMDAIKQLFPEVRVLVHSNSDTFMDETGAQDASGIFDSEKNVIHIDLSSANFDTVGEEVFHAILVNRLKTDDRVKAAVDEMISSVRKSTNKKVSKQLDRLTKQYEGKERNEEYMAKLFGILSENYNSFTYKAKNAIKDFIRKIANIFNLPINATLRDEQVFNFMNTLARKVGEGEVVVEQDVEILDTVEGDIKARKRKQKKPTVKEFIEEAREKGIPTERIKKYLQDKRGYTDEQIKELFPQKSKKKPVKKREKKEDLKEFKKKASKNIKKARFGGGRKDLYNNLKKLISYPTSKLPQEVIEEYKSLLTAFGVDTPVNIDENSKRLADLLEVINDEIKEETTKKTTKPKDPKKAEEELEIAKRDVLQKINNGKKRKLPMPKEDELASFLFDSKLIKKYLDKLSYENVNILNNLLTEINEGYIDTNKADVLKSKLVALSNYDNIKGKVNLKRVLNLGARALARLESAFSKKSPLSMRIRGSLLSNIDESLGNFEDTSIYDSTFKGAAEGMDRFDAEINEVLAQTERVNEILSTKEESSMLKIKSNEQLKSRYRIMINMLYDEYKSNKKMVGVYPPSSYLKVTIDHLSKSENVDERRAAKLLEEAAKDYNENTGIKLTKKEQKAKSILRDINDKLEDKILYVLASRGKNPVIYNNYIHHAALYNKKNQIETIEDVNKKLQKPGTKAGTTIDRTPNKIISFDPVYSTVMGAKKTLLDFYLTQPIRETKATLDLLKESDNKQDAEVGKALEGAFKEALEIVVSNSIHYYGALEKTLDGLKKVSYYAALGSVPRAGSELLSNLSYVTAVSPLDFNNGLKYTYLIYNPKLGAGLMMNSGSTETTRLFNKEALLSRFTDVSSFNRNTFNASKAKGPIREMAEFIAQNSFVGPKWVAMVDTIANKLLSTPDKMIAQPLWFGTYFSKLEELTNRKFTKAEIEKISNGDPSIMSKYKNEIQEATAAADDQLVKMATTGNTFKGVLKNTRRLTGENSGAARNFLRDVNNYMATYAINEYTTFKSGVIGLIHDGKISRAKGLALITGVTVRMTMYMVMYNLLRGLFDSMIRSITGLEAKEEEEEDIAAQTKRQLVGSIVSLLSRGTLGNLPYLPVSMLTEYVNEKELASLRDGKEYDPFKHQIVFNVLPTEKLASTNPYEILLTTFGGPYTPLIKTVGRGAVVGQRLTSDSKPETIKKYEKELKQRTLVELGGMLNLVPFFKDVRRVLMDDLYKDFGKKTSKLKLTNPEKKKYMPDVWQHEQEMKKLFESSEAYRYKKEAKERQKRLRQERLDQMFGR